MFKKNKFQTIPTKEKTKAEKTKKEPKPEKQKKEPKLKRRLKFNFNTIELLIGFACVLYYIICAVLNGFGVSILFIWLILGALLIGKSLFYIKKKENIKNLLKAFFIVFDSVFILFIVLLLVFVSGVIGASTDIPDEDCDCIIVLGAQVKGTSPSKPLKERIEAAYKYLSENENAYVIASGGQGSKEIISEAKCIADALIEKGISADRIILEEKSTSTVENIVFSLEKITDETRSVGIVSNNFHILRAKTIFKSYSDLEVHGISAKYISLIYPHYVLREFVSFSVALARGQIKL